MKTEVSNAESATLNHPLVRDLMQKQEAFAVSAHAVGALNRLMSESLGGSAVGVASAIESVRQYLHAEAGKKDGGTSEFEALKKAKEHWADKAVEWEARAKKLEAERDDLVERVARLDGRRKKKEGAAGDSPKNDPPAPPPAAGNNPTPPLPMDGNPVGEKPKDV